MKKVSYILISLIMIVVLIPTAAFAYTANSETVVDLIAGQHMDAGHIKVWNDNSNLYVNYIAAPGWCLDETHLEVASSLDKIPQANGNPIPGRFKHKESHGCVSDFTYTVPLMEDSCDLYIAAHAVVKKKNGPTDTAWGDGINFSGNNWATYFVYSIEDCNVPPSATATSTHTSTASPTHTSTSTVSPKVTPTSTVTNTPTSTVTSTATNTSTPTPTGTTSVCQPVTVAADFSQVAPGGSVEDLGVVAPNLKIDAVGTAIKIAEGVSPIVFGSKRGTTTSIGNWGLAAGGGFSDKITQKALQAPHYTFTFPGISVSNFSLHMLDFGDYNPTLSSPHIINMIAYDANGAVVDQHTLSYNTLAGSPYTSDTYGNLILTGDAFASPGQPGNWTWNVSGSGIVQVALEFGPGFEPNIGFDTLTFNCSQ